MFCGYSLGETYVCLSFWGSGSQSSSPQTATTASAFTADQRHGLQASFSQSEKEAEWGTYTHGNRGNSEAR